MKLVIAPLQADSRAIHGRLDRMDNRLQQVDHTMQNEFEAIHKNIATLSERLIRVETLARTEHRSNHERRMTKSLTPSRTDQVTPISAKPELL
jgi:hypothetical protein